MEKAMEMNSDMLFLVKRLVIAVENISEDVKNISTYMYDLSHNVSYILNEKKEKEGVSLVCSQGGDNLLYDEPTARQGVSLASACSFKYEQTNQSSVSHIDDIEHVCDAGSMSIDHNENSNILTLNTGGIRTEEEYENEESCESHDVLRTLVNNRDNVTDSAEDINDEMDIHEERTDIQSSVEAVEDKDSNTHMTRLPESQCLVAETVEPERFSELMGNSEQNKVEETNRANEELFMEYSTDSGKSLQESYTDTVASAFSSLEELIGGVGTEHKDRKEMGSRKFSGAGEGHHKAQLNRKTCKTEMHCSTSKKISSKQGMRPEKTKKPFCSDSCGKYFRFKPHLVIHKRFHAGEAPFQCALCNKTYTTKSILARHMKVHSEDRPYNCSLCGKSFKLNFNLVTHMRLHSGEKPFECKVCGKAFSQNKNLATHMRSHTDERPFSCKDCGKCFTVSSNLCRHRRHKHAGASKSL